MRETVTADIKDTRDVWKAIVKGVHRLEIDGIQGSRKLVLRVLWIVDTGVRNDFRCLDLSQL